jgi:hypothetical protein
LVSLFSITGRGEDMTGSFATGVLVLGLAALFGAVLVYEIKAKTTEDVITKMTKRKRKSGDFLIGAAGGRVTTTGGGVGIMGFVTGCGVTGIDGSI